MMQNLKTIISSDEISYSVNPDNKIFKKGIFSNLCEDTVPIESKSLKYIIDNKFGIKINLDDLIVHIETIKPYSLLYHERKCYLKIIEINKYNPFLIFIHL